MSLKDLFGKTSEKIVSKKQLDQLYTESESEGYIEQLVEDRERHLPAIDFSTASNFARYGSAEKYYVDGFKNIYQNYPYDGSKKEKQEWRNNSSQLDLYLFDNIYPKTTGYINLSSSAVLATDGTYRSSSLAQYVKIKGGPNQSATGKYDTANIYDLQTNRESNLGITALGNTVEFWFKDNLSSSNAYYNKSYALFDLWNGEPTYSSNYTRLVISKTDGLNNFSVTYRSGSSGITDQTLDYTFDSSTWHHYAFTFANSGAGDLEVCLYIDGDFISKTSYTGGGGIELANNLNNIAYIGALRSDIVTGDVSKQELGCSLGSFDEFRFWKTARTSQQIYRNWFCQVGGGSNTDDANVDLGLYLKFNEGVVNSQEISDLDKICLDSSGRVSNGAIINYDINCKSTSSAIDEYYGKTLESKDPIIFSKNPLVESAIQTYSDLGYQHDSRNVSGIYSSLPSWITEEADAGNYQDLSHLVQIVSSYFDTLHIQIQSLTNIKNVEYDSSSKPKPFMKYLLSSNGFENLEIFNDTTFLEDVLSRNENIQFEEKVHNVKNAIYQNIYNNLSYIYKSKGTEKSLRNLIRCFGIDDELIKINLYANNAQYDLNTKYTHTSIPKKFVDFNNPDRYEGFIYQKNKLGDTNTKSYIPGIPSPTGSYIPLTVQAEVIFPKNPIIESKNYSVSDFITSSLFGIHQAEYDEDNYAWGEDKFNFQVYSVKPQVGSTDVYFKLTGSFNGYGINLVTNYYKEVYNNEKWNFAVRIKPQKYEYANLTSGSSVTDYLVEFIGINSLGDSIENNFFLSASVPHDYMYDALTANKRVYAGSHYADFNSNNLLCRTDVKISSVRFWLDYLSNEELKAHSIETNNTGRQYPNWPPAFLAGLHNSSSISLASINTLALNWNFFNVSSSDVNGQFIVEDASSGSVESSSEYGLSWLNDVIRYQMPGFGDSFFENDNQVVNKEYVFSAKKQQPEILNGNDLIQIVNTDDVTRTKDSRAISYYISIEKSMSQVINDEIMNWFATIKSYNNLIGESTQKYKQEYSGLSQLRELFFKQVNNRLDFEKFFEFYKWIDSSLSMMINQLVPASANSSDKVRNMVESHMLERSKYENKLPTVEIKANPKSYPVVSHLDYSYIEQSAAPNELNETLKVNRYYSFKPQWLKQRAIRSEAPVNTALEPQNDIDREIMRQVINEKNTDSLPVLYSVDTEQTYEGRKDVTRMFTKLYRLSSNREIILEDAVIPVNIQNIPVSSTFVFASEIEANSSASQVVPAYKKYNKTGNYQHTYEPVFMSGRKDNNKSFVELEGNVSGAVNVDSYLGVASRTLPVRQAHKNIIVERFSAPGGAEVNSRGYLDTAAEEYSVYNSLNYRNSRVRRVLNAWLAESASINENYPSYHKVNKNPAHRADAITTYDNEFVTHQIPQSDQQYSWITASLSVPFSSSGFISNYDNTTAEYEFLSASNISIDFPVPYGTVLLTSSYLTNRLFDFNYSSDINALISYQLFDKEINTQTNTISRYILPYFDTVDAFQHAVSYIYLTTLNGPYQWPTWKQIRNAENPLVVLSRKNNNILVQDKPTRKIKIININGVSYQESYYPANEQTFTSYREPPVSYNKPLEQTVIMSGSVEPIQMVNTYDNNKERFVNFDLSNRVGKQTRTELQTYDVLKSLEKDGIYEPKPNVTEISYSVQIFPAKVNTGLKETRSKPTYMEVAGTGSNGYDRNAGDIRSFWRNDINDRRRTNAYDSLTNTGSINILNISQVSSSNTASQYIGLTRNSGANEQVLRFTENYNRNYHSIYSLDNEAVVNNNTHVDYYEFQPEDPGYPGYYAQIITEIDFSSSIRGELIGFDEFEARNFLALPDGNYENRDIVRSSGQTYTQEFFVYNTEYNFVRPKPSYAYKIHYPGISTNIVNITPGLNEFYTTYLINMGMPFKTNILAGKNPWYDSYDSYFEDIRPYSIDHSIIPEFNFSENSDYYIKEKDGDFKTPPPENYISLAGSEISVNAIDNAYNITDKINNFIFNDYEGSKKLTLTISGIKKLLPYNGFYPQERTAQLVSLFQKSFFNISTNDLINGYPTYNGNASYYGSAEAQVSGSPLVQQIQTLLQPYFAPGILFNTIKAGIAMDWPTIYTGSGDAETSLSEKLGPVYGKWNPLGYGGLDPETTGVPYFYSTSSFESSSASTKVTVLKNDNLYRIPFESLIDLRGYNLNNTLYYLDPTRANIESFSDSGYYQGHPSSSIRYNPQFGFENKNSNNNQTRRFSDNRYQLAINNFLAEIPKFFLQNQSLTSFTSTKPVNEIRFTPGKTYEMYLKIEKEQNLKMILDTTIPDYRIYEKNFNTELDPDWELVNESAKISAASVFGPPTQFFLSSSYTENLYGDLSYDAPAYAPYAPPYYYGPQHIKFSFTPDSETYSSYQDIINNLTVSCEPANSEMNDFFSSSISSLGGNLIDASNPITNLTSYKNRMPLSSSIKYDVIVPQQEITYDLKGKIINFRGNNDTSISKWRIQTKFETPILNFNTDSNINLLPYETNQDTETDHIHRIRSITTYYKYGFTGMWSGYAQTGSNSGVSLSVIGGQNPNTNIEDLASLCGFNAETKYIGQIAAKKEISEAIVMIPFTKIKNHGLRTNIKNAETINEVLGENKKISTADTNGPYYFKVDPLIINANLNENGIDIDFKDSNVTYQDIKKALSYIAPKDSILKTMKSMTNYVIPPHLDWINNRDIDPFVMYIFEFTHNLDGSELADIWQGVMPKSAMQAEKDTVKLQHDISENEFFHGKKLPDDIQWKVFKIKKRANYSYDSLINGRDERFTFKTGEEELVYSYNWPYDYFSLVELVNIEATLKVNNQNNLDAQAAALNKLVQG